MQRLLIVLLYFFHICTSFKSDYPSILWLHVQSPMSHAALTDTTVQPKIETHMELSFFERNETVIKIPVKINT